ncbi:YciI family protein [Halomonas colorata]|uniref:YciI family protein n=1 Tax=Halomonas colorata TaxID=2742615 RepID=A0ABR9FW46_9GAMM|nr:YciI family protein [Halomonas colorata]MBE0462871.1 YciI family protein [Halomonas colorata]
MPFMIETFDKPGHQELRLEIRDEHLAYLDAHSVLLLACGAKLSDDSSTASGGLYLVDVETREEAQALIRQDPFYIAGLFEDIKIVRWRKAYLNKQCLL